VKATLIDEPFDQKGWIFEVKWDGYRAFATKDHLTSKNQTSYDKRFPEILHELKNIPGKFMLDGEIVVLDEKGRSNFQMLQNKEGKPCYYVFDLLTLNGKDLRKLPLIERKEILKRLLKQSKVSRIRFSEHVKEKGIAFFELAKKKGLEGIMAKKEDSPYVFTRSRDWLKIKVKQHAKVVIGGYTEPKGGRKFFGGLLVGVYKKDKELHYVGRVGGGFDGRTLKEVYNKLQKIKTEKSPFITKLKLKGVTWLKPQYSCNVVFAEWTNDKKLRQPIYDDELHKS